MFNTSVSEKNNVQQKSMLQKLGINVEFFTKILKRDNEESRLLSKIGELRTPKNQEYIGTIAVHYYIDKTAILKERYDVCTATHISFIKDTNENIAALGMNNAVIAVRKYFNPEFEHKSTNLKDERNEVTEGRIDG